MKSALYALMLAGLVVGSARGQEVAAGRTAFSQRCSVCHVNAAGARATVGPNLFGVVGRIAGKAEYDYSSALKASKLAWTPVNLTKWLAGPGQLVPGTKMAVAVPSEQTRANIVAYLATLKAK